MSQGEREAALAKEVQQRLEKKIRENEISQLEYWKVQLDQLAIMKPEGISSLQLQIKKVAEKMANRIMMLKRGA